jgi:hypothetical protein
LSEGNIMSIFNHVGLDKLNVFVALMQSATAFPPILTDQHKAIFKEGDTTAKAQMCAGLLIQWQNHLNKAKNDPWLPIIYNENTFEQYVLSQKTLNKLKRKFTRLFIEGMPSSQCEMLAKEAVKYLGMPSVEPSLISDLFNYHGADAICLELLAPYANHRLDPPVFPRNKMVSLLSDDPNYRVDMRLILAVSSASEHFCIAPNTWGYERQESSPFTEFTVGKVIAAITRTNEHRNRNQLKSNQSPWEQVVKPSAFAESMHYAKATDGSYLGTCSERADHIFRLLAKRRDFSIVLRAGLKPGDHVFVISQDPNQHDFLDGWDGAKIYAAKDKGKYLYDYAGVNLLDGKPWLKPFVSGGSQKIMVGARSIFSLETFKQVSTSKHPQLIDLLHEFHQIPNLQRKEKMLKAMEITRFIENKMPLYEFIDPNVHELYDQMVYLTKKERKRGLALPPLNDNDRCLVNETLQNLDLSGLQKHLKENQPMDGVTFLHAIKASLRANNIQFLKEVVDAKIPIEASPLADFYQSKPSEAILKLADQLYGATQALDFRPLCKNAVDKH